MNYASLFSGIGGFDLAFDRAGAHCVAQVEKIKTASAYFRGGFQKWKARVNESVNRGVFDLGGNCCGFFYVDMATATGGPG